MEYLLIIAMQIFGVAFHAGQKIVALGDEYPEMKKREIIAAFWKEDWDTLAISLVVLGVHLALHLTICRYVPHWADNIYFELISIAGAFGLGYFGQRLLYKALGSAEQFINRKIEDRLK